MLELYDPTAPKKATNLSINSDLLVKAKAKGINLSAVLEQALTEKLLTTEGDNWVRVNENAIKAYNAFVDEQGCLSDEFKEF
ncbi:MAG: type II toxin-antitoxin system CcdA family antitoxin [Pseudohongiellaceae bacterium]